MTAKKLWRMYYALLRKEGYAANYRPQDGYRWSLKERHSQFVMLRALARGELVHSCPLSASMFDERARKAIEMGYVDRLKAEIERGMV